jgi:hypothetical protein
MSKQNVGASTSHNPLGLHGLLQDSFTLPFPIETIALNKTVCVVIFWEATLLPLEVQTPFVDFLENGFTP